MADRVGACSESVADVTPTTCQAGDSERDSAQMFLASLDQTVVDTAVPRIIIEPNDANLYASVVSAYLLTSTVTMPIYRKFSDVFGRKLMLMIGVSLFVLGSWLCGASQ